MLKTFTMTTVYCTLFFSNFWQVCGTLFITAFIVKLYPNAMYSNLRKRRFLNMELPLLNLIHAESSHRNKAQMGFAAFVEIVRLMWFVVISSLNFGDAGTLLLFINLWKLIIIT